MTTVEILKRAKALLEERGWCQGEYFGADGRMCMFGACLAAQGLGPSISIFDCGHTGELVDPVLAKVTGTKHVTRWNDALGRTKEEVLAALDRAIELTEKA